MRLVTTLAGSILSLALSTAPLATAYAADEVTVVLTATAGDPIEQNDLNQTTPIFSTPIGPDGLFADTLAAPIADGPILSIDAAAIEGDADPFIDLEFTVTNLTPFDATVTVTSFVPLDEVFGPGLVIDTSTSGNLTDGDDNPSFLGLAPGGAIFEALIDGEIVDEISLGNPLSSPSGVFAGFVSNIFAEPELLPAALAENSIGINSSFVLGPGDTLDYSGFFSVTPVVPEPATFSLLLLGGVAMVGRRYRS